MSARIITARNVNTALSDGLWHLHTSGVVQASRNGPVLRAPGPVITQYTHPWERVLFSPLRDANPFFHLYEAVWMVAGRNDAKAVAEYAKTMAMFADEDGVLNGAYGHRWRSHFGYDQLAFLVDELRSNPTTRRVVLTMWDAGYGTLTEPNGDPHKARAGSKDVPCNTHVYFNAACGALDMTVCNRSNDIVWGAYGANYVHMSFLHEYVALAAGLQQGSYYQMSNDYHTYTERPDVERLITESGVVYQPDDRYRAGLNLIPLMHHASECGAFIEACEQAAHAPTDNVYPTNDFFYKVFGPLMRAHKEYTYGDYRGALYAANLCYAEDWRMAAIEWIERRKAAAKALA